MSVPSSAIQSYPISDVIIDAWTNNDESKTLEGILGDWVTLKCDLYSIDNASYFAPDLDGHSGTWKFASQRQRRTIARRRSNFLQTMNHYRLIFWDILRYSVIVFEVLWHVHVFSSWFWISDLRHETHETFSLHLMVWRRQLTLRLKVHLPKICMALQLFQTESQESVNSSSTDVTVNSSFHWNRRFAIFIEIE